MNPDLSAGDEVRVQIGPEVFSPIRYHTFTVGPVSVSTKVRPGESAEEAHVRAWSIAEVAFEAQFSTCLQQFLDRVREVHSHTERNKNG